MSKINNNDLQVSMLCLYSREVLVNTNNHLEHIVFPVNQPCIIRSIESALSKYYPQQYR